VLLAGYKHCSANNVSTLIIGLGAAFAALVENIAVLGLDNLIVPLCIGLLLTNV